eukprot:m.460947 g.460947  ORF g.460947 m.460947 type:complete len:391 (+) comp22176_c0_seq1:324-1496(+)
MTAEVAFFGRPRGAGDRSLPPLVATIIANSRALESQTQPGETKAVDSSVSDAYPKSTKIIADPQSETASASSGRAGSPPPENFVLPGFRQGSDAELMVSNLAPPPEIDVGASSDDPTDDAAPEGELRRNSFETAWQAPSSDATAVQANPEPPVVTATHSSTMPLDTSASQTSELQLTRTAHMTPLSSAQIKETSAASETPEVPLQLMRSTHFTPSAFGGQLEAEQDTPPSPDPPQVSAAEMGRRASLKLKKMGWDAVQSPSPPPSEQAPNDTAQTRLSASAGHISAQLPEQPVVSPDPLRSTMPSSLTELYAVRRAPHDRSVHQDEGHGAQSGGDQAASPLFSGEQPDKMVATLNDVLRQNAPHGPAHDWPAGITSRMPRRKPVRATDRS